jgi:hypothetical protein
MKPEDNELIIEAFKFLQGNGDVLNLGFEILLMHKEQIRNDPNFYNRLIKHFRRIPSMTNKPNLNEIKTRHTKFAEQFIGIEFKYMTTSRFGYVTERLITYFKNNPDETKQTTSDLPGNG